MQQQQPSKTLTYCKRTQRFTLCPFDKRRNFLSKNFSKKKYCWVAIFVIVTQAKEKSDWFFWTETSFFQATTQQAQWPMTPVNTWLFIIFESQETLRCHEALLYKTSHPERAFGSLWITPPFSIQNLKWWHFIEQSIQMAAASESKSELIRNWDKQNLKSKWHAYFCALINVPRSNRHKQTCQIGREDGWRRPAFNANWCK